MSHVDFGALGRAKTPKEARAAQKLIAEQKSGGPLKDPFGTKRRGKKKERVATEAGAKTKDIGEVLFGTDEGGILAESGRRTGQGFDAARTNIGNLFGQTRADIGTSFTGARGDISGLFGEARAGLDPFAQAGEEALESVLGSLGIGGRTFDPSFLANTPGFQFQLQQGQQALTSGASAAGLVDSSKTRKGFLELGNQLAGQRFDQFISNLFQTAEMGQQARGTQANLFSGEAGILGQLTSSEAGIGAQLTGTQGGIFGNLATQEQGMLNSIEQARTAGLLGTRTGEVDAVLAGQLANINAQGANVAQLTSLGTQGIGALTGRGSTIPGFPDDDALLNATP